MITKLTKITQSNALSQRMTTSKTSTELPFVQGVEDGGDEVAKEKIEDKSKKNAAAFSNEPDDELEKQPSIHARFVDAIKVEEETDVEEGLPGDAIYTPPPTHNTWKPDFSLPCKKWCKKRWKLAFVKCLSSTTVLTVRLLLDPSPRAYVIHSVIVFLDMVLIHFFTHSLWLSISGELLTIIFFLAFHFTKETVYELMETTGIAMLASFHLIAESSKLKERKEELEYGIEDLRRKSVAILRRSSMGIGISPEQLKELIEDEEDLEFDSKKPQDSNQLGPSWFHIPTIQMDPVYSKRARTWGERFFEYFLDGSAGVMYTSFFGLILDELIAYGEGGSKK